jgi:hypothetical protein
MVVGEPRVNDVTAAEAAARGPDLVRTKETFRHEVSGWTAGQLKEALAGVPDDLRVIVTPDEVFIDVRPEGG